MFFGLQKHQLSEEGAADPPWPECVDELCWNNYIAPGRVVIVNRFCFVFR